jgi:hypothetical protein
MTATRQDAFFYVVPYPTIALPDLGRIVYPDTSDPNAQEFLRLNQPLADLTGTVRRGQLLLLPHDACRDDEAELIATLREINQDILDSLTWPERETLAHGHALLNNVVTHQDTLRTGPRVVSTVGSGVLTSLSLETRYIGRTLKGLEDRYVQTYRRHGKFTPEFRAYRHQVYRTLDAPIGRIAKRITLGLPLQQDAAKGLRVRHLRQILHWRQHGTAGGVGAFRKHFDHLKTINRYLTRGGYITLALDTALTADTLVQACRAEDRATCHRTAAVEGAGLVGGVAGGSFGGVVAYTACNLLFGLESVGTSLLWCGLVAGAAGGYVVGEGGGRLFKAGGNLIFEQTYPLGPP